MIDITSLTMLYHDIENMNDETVIDAVVISEELYETILRMKHLDRDKVDQFFGAKIYTHKYLGNTIVCGNKKKLIEAGFIQPIKENKK